MSIVVLSIAVLLLSAPAALVVVDLGPAARMRVTMAAVYSGVAVLIVGVTAAALPLELWWHDGMRASGVVLDHAAPGGPLAWVLAGLVAMFIAVTVVEVIAASRRARRRATLPRWAAEAVLEDPSTGCEVRIASARAQKAFAVPARPRPVIVVSRGLADALSPGEFRAVLAHEAAHLRLGHHRHLFVLALYERLWGWLPGGRAIVSRHRRSVEQWTDAVAAQSFRCSHNLASARERLAPASNAFRPPTAPDHSRPVTLVAVVAAIVVLAAAGTLASGHVMADVIAALNDAH